MSSVEVALKYEAYLDPDDFSDQEAWLVRKVIDRAHKMASAEYKDGWEHGALATEPHRARRFADADILGGEWREGYAHGLAARTASFGKRGGRR